MDFTIKGITATLSLRSKLAFGLVYSPDMWVIVTVAQRIRELIEIAKRISFIPQKIQIRNSSRKEYIIRDIKIQCCYVDEIPKDILCEIDEQGKPLTTKKYEL